MTMYILWAGCFAAPGFFALVQGLRPTPAEPGVTRQQMAALVSDPIISGEIVTQLLDPDPVDPDGHIFEVLVAAPTQQDDIDALLSDIQGMGSPLVRQATYVYMPSSQSACLHQTANATFEAGRKTRCAYSDTFFPQAYHMFQEIRHLLPGIAPHLGTEKVHVLVIDTGFSGELIAPGKPFHEIFIRGGIVPLVASDPRVESVPFEDVKGHGTKVTSVIAASPVPGPSNERMEGIASAFMGSGLVLQLLNREGLSISSQVDLIRQYAPGAGIVNLSWVVAHHVDAFKKGSVLRIFDKAADTNPGTLFVAAADNKWPVQSIQSLFAGIVKPNSIGVQATARCNPRLLADPARYWDTGYGDFPVHHFLAAPGVDVPVVDRDGSIVTASGNSFATPQITSLAAILKWLRPSLTPAQIKHYLTSNAPEGPPVSYHAREQLMFWDSTKSYPVIDFYHAILGQALAMAKGGSYEGSLDRLIGSFHRTELEGLDQRHVPLAKTCNAEIFYAVQDHGSLYYRSTQEISGVWYGGFSLFDGSWFLSVLAPNNWYLNILSGANLRIELDSPYYFTEQSLPGLNTATISFLEYGHVFPSAIQDETNYSNSFIEFTACQITERFPGDYDIDAATTPQGGWLEGRIVGTVAYRETPADSPVSKASTGYFRLPFLFNMSVTDPEARNPLEDICQGGREE